MQSCYGFDEDNPGFFFGGGVVADSARDDEELAWPDGDGTAVGFRAADVEEATDDEEHLVLMLVRVPGKFSLHFGNLDELTVDLTDDSRRPKLGKSGACEFERHWSLLN